MRGWRIRWLRPYAALSLARFQTNRAVPDPRDVVRLASPLQFVARKSKETFLIGSDPVRECTALNVGGNGLICLADRVRTEVGNAPLHDGPVSFWSSDRAMMSETRPLGAYVTWPCGLGP
jgi:hypothetical protein